MPSAIIELVLLLLQALWIAILIRAILSWFMQLGGDPLTRLLLNITDPIIEPIRGVMMRILPLPIDFSPFVAILLIQLLASLVSRVAF